MDTPWPARPSIGIDPASRGRPVASFACGVQQAERGADVAVRDDSRKFISRQGKTAARARGRQPGRTPRTNQSSAMHQVPRPHQFAGDSFAPCALPLATSTPSERRGIALEPGAPSVTFGLERVRAINAAGGGAHGCRPSPARCVVRASRPGRPIARIVISACRARRRPHRPGRPHPGRARPRSAPARKRPGRRRPHLVVSARRARTPSRARIAGASGATGR